MGHNFIENEIVNHPFFGTQKVVEELKKREGWGNGLIIFQPNCCLRDSETGLVCGFN